jgi:hypothetical protein
MPIGKIGFQAQGPSTVVNPISRYAVVTTHGMEVWVVSSSSVYTNLNWTRAGTIMTINRIAHGHSAGNMVIIRNTNLEYQNVVIDTVSADSFNVVTTDVGDVIGTFGSYSLGFTYQHTGAPSTGGILYAPTGDYADCQLLTLRVRTGARLGTTYNVVVPASSINGAGDNTSLSDCFIPDYSVRTDADNLSATSATIATGSLVGSYSTFQIGNLGILSRIIILHF